MFYNASICGFLSCWGSDSNMMIPHRFHNIFEYCTNLLDLKETTRCRNKFFWCRVHCNEAVYRIYPEFAFQTEDDGDIMFGAIPYMVIISQF